MQYSFATAITTILFASTFTSAAVLPRAADINIQFKTGDGDASIQETIAVGKLTTVQTNGAPLGKAVNAEVVDADVTCQFFSDAKGTTKLGGTLDSRTTASFTDDSDGGVDSNANDAVALGSVCCAASKDFKNVCDKNNGNNDAFNVRVQIGGLSELATQGEILANEKRQPLKAPLIGEGAISVSIVESDKPAKCQAFDKNVKKIGGPFTNAQDATFALSNIATILCHAA